MNNHQPPSQPPNHLGAVLKLAQTCKYDAKHTDQVTRYALSLYDTMQPLHKYGPLERSWLEMAGILHDIGWIDGREGHHKTTLKIILNSPILDLSNKERLIVGSIARYHRKSLPGLEHDHFAALEPGERRMVVTLASILRLADGLDHLGEQKIRSILVEPGKKSVSITCKIISDCKNKPKETPKSDLFEIVFRRNVELKWSALL
jgi:exopolyphosphatase/pppGpp-phosphohydrolase